MSNNRLLRMVSIILCGAIIALTAAGCGGNSGSSAPETTAADTAAETEETTTADPLADDVPELDFGGKPFRVSVMSKYEQEFLAEEESGDVCNDAVYARNRLVEERFNTVITPLVTNYVDNNTHVNYIKNTVLAGEDAFDLAALYVYVSGIPILAGLYQSWKGVPYVDFERPWWVQSANEAFTIGGDRYIAVGSVCVTTLLLAYGIFFNKTVAEGYNVGNLYDVVYDGKWTIDRLGETAKGVYADLNGNNQSDKDDLFGFIAEKVTNLDAYLPAFDQSITAFDDEGYPYFIINCEKTYNAVDKVYSLYYENEGSYITPAAGDEITKFARGEALFLTTWMNNAFTVFRDMEDDYGILPYPKFDEAQEDYLSNSMDNYSTLGIPMTADDLDFIGAVIEVLSAESYKSVMPAYYEVALKTKFTRDEDSIAMLELIMDGLNYDFSVLHSSSYLSSIYTRFRIVIAKPSRDFASDYASIEEKLLTSLESLIGIYKELGER